LIVIGTAAVAAGFASCSSSSSTPAHAASTTSKAAFCKGNDAIDVASANVTSNAGFLAVLKSHTADITAMEENAPSGHLGSEVKATVKISKQAIATNNAALLNNAPNGADIDTYCGVDGNGNPLPAYFAQGAHTSFCTSFNPLVAAISNTAGNPTQIVAVLKSHAALITQLQGEASSVPSSVRSDVTALLSKAQTVLSTGSAAAVGQGQGYFMEVSLYCGDNM